jgi:hypothetical protein
VAAEVDTTIGLPVGGDAVTTYPLTGELPELAGGFQSTYALEPDIAAVTVSGVESAGTLEHVPLDTVLLCPMLS